MRVVYRGGETVFPESGFTICPRKGNAVYFEYANSRQQLEARSLHAGAPVIEGEKWAVTKWMRARRFIPALERVRRPSPVRRIRSAVLHHDRFGEFPRTGQGIAASNSYKPLQTLLLVRGDPVVAVRPAVDKLSAGGELLPQPLDIRLLVAGRLPLRGRVSLPEQLPEATFRQRNSDL